MDKAFDVAGSIVILGMITTVVAHPQSAKVVTAIGNAFAGGIKAAMGH